MGGWGHCRPNSGKIHFSGKNHVKFGHFVNFSGKYHVNYSGILLIFHAYIFGQKCVAPQSSLSSYAYECRPMTLVSGGIRFVRIFVALQFHLLLPHVCFPNHAQIA